MKDNMKCQHVLSDDITYKEVVVIGNGPSGMVTSYMLAGNVPYLRTVPEDLPIDDMLRARLANLPEGQSLYETDLIELAEGLEGRSQNPIPLLMDNLFRPCTDLGIEADPLIEWRYEHEKQIDHIVLGRGPPGGSWPTFPGSVRTLSPGAWLTLPPHAPRSAAPLSARAVANYCLRYVRASHLQRYFRNNVIVTSVTRAPPRPDQCTQHCPLAANYCVTGYEKSTLRQFRYLCRRVVLASGSERANTLANVAPFALHSLAELERALQVVQALPPPHHPVLVVGSGVSAADCVCLSLRSGLRAAHVHRTPAASLAHIPRLPRTDLAQVYKMMCDGPAGGHHNYTPYPQHVIVDVIPELTHATLNDHIDARDIEDYNIGLKRVKLLNLLTNETTELLVNIISVFIGSRPDLFFLQTNFSLNCIDVKPCQKCLEEKAKRKIEEKSIKNHWGYIKSVIGQMQICKSRYLNEKCICDDQCDAIIPYNSECQCEVNPYRDGLGFGVDPEKPVDSRNPIAVDKGTHELLNSPKGLYALGPLTADNFMRFIPGGALAIVAHIHKEKMTCHS